MTSLIISVWRQTMLICSQIGTFCQNTIEEFNKLNTKFWESSQIIRNKNGVCLVYECFPASQSQTSVTFQWHYRTLISPNQGSINMNHFLTINWQTWVLNPVVLMVLNVFAHMTTVLIFTTSHQSKLPDSLKTVICL